MTPPPPAKKREKQSDCAILEGRFVWAAAAGIVHRVCRIGRNEKTTRSKAMLDHCATSEDTGRRGRSGGSRRKRGAVGGSRASSDAAANHRRPNRPAEGRRSGGGRQARARRGVGGGRGLAGDADHGADSPERAEASVRPRGSGRDAGGGAGAGTAGVNQSNRDNAGSDPAEEGGGGQPSGREAEGERRPGAQDEQRQPERVGAGVEKDGGQGEPAAEAAALGKEAAFLKADEDTEGGQGAMLFSEFVEALTRLCLKRYAPRAGSRGGGGAALAGVGWKSSSATWTSSFEPKHLARRNLNVRGGGAAKELRGVRACGSASQTVSDLAEKQWKCRTTLAAPGRRSLLEHQQSYSRPRRAVLPPPPPRRKWIGDEGFPSSHSSWSV